MIELHGQLHGVLARSGAQIDDDLVGEDPEIVHPGVALDQRLELAHLILDPFKIALQNRQAIVVAGLFLLVSAALPVQRLGK